jgi:hypothetical protein
MRDERLEVSVSFDEMRGYVATANGLPTITALSLAVQRRRVEERLIGEDLDANLVFDRAAPVSVRGLGPRRGSGNMVGYLTAR